jgi:hypothetical protein
VRAAYDAWGSQTAAVSKQFVVLGAAHGSEADYGHGDLAVGRHAKRDLFLPIDAFLGAADS